MKKQGIRIRTALVVAAILTGCTTDRSKQKAELQEKAKAYLAQGKNAEAVIELRNAAEIAPSDAGIHFALAQAYQRTGQVGQAREQYKKSLTLNPSQPQAQAELSSILLAERKFEEADPFIRALLKDPTNPRAHLLRAEYLFGMQQPDKAIEEYRAAIALDPSRVEVHTGLGAVLFATGHVEDARKELVETAAKNPQSVEAHLALSQFYLSQGQFGPAETEIQLAIHADATAVAPKLVLASIYARTKRNPEAEDLYTKLKADNPQDARAYLGLGQFLLSTGQRERAIREFEGVLAKHPDLLIQQSLVDLYIEGGRLQDADKLNQDVLKASGNNTLALIAAGRILLAKGQYGDAAVKLEAAIHANPRSADGFYWLGQAQSKQGLTSQASSAFKDALKLNPSMQAATVALAEIGRRSGDLKQADQVAANAASGGKASAPVQVERARIMTDQGRRKESESRLLGVLESDPTDITALTELVRLYSKDGRSKDAVRRLSGLVRDHDSDANLHFLLGLASYDARDYSTAANQARRALELNRTFASAYTLLANTDLAAGREQAAIEDLLKAIELNRRNVTNYMALENIYKRQGNWQDAKRICEQAYQISPSPAIAVELAFLYLDHGGDAIKALSLAQEANRQLPTEPVVSDILGWALYKTGSVDSAIRELQKAVAKIPSSVVFNHHLGTVYLAAGKKSAARRCLELVAAQNSAYAKSSGALDLLASLGTSGSQKLAR